MKMIMNPKRNKNDFSVDVKTQHACLAVVVMACAAFILTFTSVRAAAQQSDGAEQEQGQLRFRFVGPKAGNRVSAIAGVPGDASTYYAGAASGGVWKSS